MAIGKQLSDLNSDGTGLGQSATDKISFFGATPVARQGSTSLATAAVTVVTATTGWMFASVTGFNNLVNQVEAMRAALCLYGIVASA